MRRAWICGVVVCVLTLALAGCSDDETSGSGGATATTTSTGGMGGAGGAAGGSGGEACVPPMAGGTCNELDLSVAPIVQVIRVDTAIPAPMGGDLPEGEGVLTDVTIYTGVGGPTGPRGDTRQEVTVCGCGVCQGVLDAGAGEERFNLDVSAMGTDVALTVTCGTGQDITWGYTATGNSIVLLDGVSGLALTFTYQ